MKVSWMYILHQVVKRLEAKLISGCLLLLARFIFMRKRFQHKGWLQKLSVS
nr:MAG TPA: hypothetical protein [Caudoviricetes sp.]